MVETNFQAQGKSTEDVGLRLLKGTQARKTILHRSDQQMDVWVPFLTWDFYCLEFKTSDSLKRLNRKKI